MQFLRQAVSTAAILAAAPFFAAAATQTAASAPPANAAASSPQDLSAGKNLFQRHCAACHYADTARNKIGPSLQGVYGRAAGQAAAFPYSPALKAAGGKGVIWNTENLAKFLQSPQQFTPGTRMPPLAPRLAPADAEQIIRYLEQVRINFSG